MSVRVEDGCYVRISYKKEKSANQEEVKTPLTNFIILPKEFIRCEGGEHVKARIQPKSAASEQALIPPMTWESGQAFTRYFNQWGSTISTLNSPSPQLIKKLVFSHQGIPKRRGEHVLGRHGDVFLLGAKVVSRGGLLDRPPVVYVPRMGSNDALSGYLTEKLSFNDLPEREYHEFVAQLFPALLAMNTPEVMLPRIGWFFATPFKPLFLRMDGVGHFPHLAEIGESGSGKTGGLKPLYRMFGFDGDPFGANQKPFVLLLRLSETNAIPLWFDEYKPWKIPEEHRNALSEGLRKSYTGMLEERGRADQSVVGYRLVAPVVISGEMAFAEVALQERSIPSAPRRQTLIGVRGDSYRAAFKQVVSLPLSSFGIRYYAWTLGHDMHRHWEMSLQRAKEVLGTETPDRVIDNLAIMEYGLRCFARFGREHGVPAATLNPINDLLPSVLRSCRDLVTGRGISIAGPLEQFIGTLGTLVQVGRLQAGKHYYLKGETLYLAFGPCYGEFRKYMRETESESDRLSDVDYQRLLRENRHPQGYVRSDSVTPRWGPCGPIRSYAIDLAEAEHQGIDTSGFGRWSRSVE